MFPIHQADLIPSKENQNSDTHDATSQTEKSDFTTCKFREFIYSYFVDLTKFELDPSQKKLLQIARNVTTHANHHSASEAKKTIQEQILNTAFKELFVRSNDDAKKVLEKIYGEKNFNNVFGPLEEENLRNKPELDNRESKMSDCFQHSEQAFLKALARNGFSMREFLLEYLYKNFQPNSWQVSNNPSHKQAISQPISADQIPSLNDDKIDTGKGLAQQKAPTQPTITEIEFMSPIPIAINIFSPRHICKFCRGSLSLMQPKILKLFESITLEDKGLSSNNPKEIKTTARKLAKPVIDKNCPGNEALKSDLTEPDDFKCLDIIYNYCVLKKSSDHYCIEFKEFIESYYQYKLYNQLKKIFPALDKNVKIVFKNVDLHTYATSFKETKKEIM